MSALIEKKTGKINFQMAGGNLKWGITNILVRVLLAE